MLSIVKKVSSDKMFCSEDSQNVCKILKIAEKVGKKARTGLNSRKEVRGLKNKLVARNSQETNVSPLK